MDSAHTPASSATLLSPPAVPPASHGWGSSTWSKHQLALASPSPSLGVYKRVHIAHVAHVLGLKRDRSHASFSSGSCITTRLLLCARRRRQASAALGDHRFCIHISNMQCSSWHVPYGVNVCMYVNAIDYSTHILTRHCVCMCPAQSIPHIHASTHHPPSPFFPPTPTTDSAPPTYHPPPPPDFSPPCIHIHTSLSPAATPPPLTPRKPSRVLHVPQKVTAARPPRRVEASRRRPVVMDENGSDE